MNLDESMEKFRELTREAAPHQHEIARLSHEMVQLSQQITLAMVTKAFPDAEVITIYARSEIRPTDMAKSSGEAITMMREHNIQPDLIIVDESRYITTLAIRKPTPNAKKKTKA